MQGDYRLPYVALPEDSTEHIGVWGERHRRFLKTQHRVRYFNLLTAGTLNTYLADLDQRAEKMFADLVKSLAEKEQVTEKLKVGNIMLWVRKMNNIRNRATEIVNEQVIYRWEKGTTYGESFRRLCLNFICEIRMHNLSEQTIWLSKR